MGEPKGHEQAGRRPVLVVSNDNFNRSPAKLAVVVPLTKRFRGNPLHVAVEPGESGLERTSYIKCEDIRCVSHERLGRPLGAVSPVTMSAVENNLLDLLALS
jgi:mRNA interferase MazF